jgi:hypothetical protein
MGTVDMTDVLDFLDGVVDDDARLDGARVGIQGGSYGGYLTAWTIAHDHRFAGAIVERGFLDPVSFQGTSDIGSFFGDEYVGTERRTWRGRARWPSCTTCARRLSSCTPSWTSVPPRAGDALLRGAEAAGTDAEMLIFPGRTTN